MNREDKFINELRNFEKLDNIQLSNTYNLYKSKTRKLKFISDILRALQMTPIILVIFTILLVVNLKPYLVINITFLLCITFIPLTIIIILFVIDCRVRSNLITYETFIEYIETEIIGEERASL